MSRIDNELLHGSDEDFESLHKRYAKSLKGFIYNTKLSRTTDQINDVCQLVWMKVYLKKDQFDPTANFASWLFKIAIYTILNYNRDLDRRLPTVPFGEEESPVYTSWPVDLAESNELRERVTRAISHLPPDERDAIDLTYIQGVLPTRTAPKKTRSACRRGRRALRKSLRGLV